MALIPCFLCGVDVPIRIDKNNKRYFICNECGVQAFIRTEKGITRLDDLLRSLRTRNFEFTKHKESFFQICAILREIDDLKGQIKQLKRKRGFFSTDADTQRAIKALRTRVKALLSVLEEHAKSVQPIAN
jgi:hypothetical protein